MMMPMTKVRVPQGKGVGWGFLSVFDGALVMADLSPYSILALGVG